jgi:hypothetical protein
MDKKPPEIIEEARSTAISPRMVYHVPRVMDYGNLTDLTCAKGGTHGDGGLLATKS